MPARVEITGIQLTLKKQDGSSETVVIDPKVNGAIYWGDEAVMKTLVPYYMNTIVKNGDAGIDHLVKNFGPGATEIDGYSNSMVKGEFIARIWMHPNGNTLLPFLAVTKGGIPNKG
ncbi:MAG: hypothetical protein HYV24_01845 [Deltaproteobacteria bacterium]|nr:hypothetical protein [Deltaproteobacteria bacterium]